MRRDLVRACSLFLFAACSRQARADTLRMAVVAIEPAPLEGRPEAVLYAMMRESLDAEQQLRVCREELWGVASYVNGWQAQFTALAVIQPVGSDTLRSQALTSVRRKGFAAAAERAERSDLKQLFTTLSSHSTGADAYVAFGTLLRRAPSQTRLTLRHCLTFASNSANQCST